MFQQAPIRISKFILQHTGTYNTQYRRPYATNGVNSQQMAQFTERLQGTRRFVPSMLSGISNQIMAPQAQPEKEIVIPEGWNERRIRFMMEVEIRNYVGGVEREVILGYTNWAGLSHAGDPDPQMTFFINSTLQTKVIEEFTPMGMQQRSQVLDNSHIIARDDFKGVQLSQPEFKMRPQDVHAMVQSAFYAPGMQKAIGGGEGAYDTRVILTNQPIKSSRKNGLASNFMAKTLDSYSAAISSGGGDFGEDTNGILDAARGYAQENSALQDSFIKAIAEIQGVFHTHTFTMADLRRLDPQVDTVRTTIMPGPMQTNRQHEAGDTAEWGSATAETVAATTLSNSVPSIMMELALTVVSFQSTNRASVTSQPLTTLSSLKGLNNNINLQQFGEMFVRRLEEEIIRDITWDNQLSYDLRMDVNLFGETSIWLALEGRPMYQYVTPSFCDALLVPVLSNNYQNVENLANDFSYLFSSINGNSENFSAHTNVPQPRFGSI